MQCEYYTPKKRKLCSGDFKPCTLQTRVFTAPGPGDLDGSETFNTVLDPVWAVIETLETSVMSAMLAKISGVNISDSPSHTFRVRYDPTISYEVDKHFFLYDSRRFRVTGAHIDNENKEYVVIYCKETGDSDQLATGA